MRWTLWLVAIFVFLHVADAGAQLTGAPSGDPRQLNFQLFEAAKKGRTRDVTLYLKHGASINARDRFGNPALLLAALSGRAKTVKVLLDAGSAVNHRNLGGSSALLRAAKAGKRKSVNLLLAAGAEGRRYALPNSRIMLHQPSGGFQGQATDIEIHAKEILALRRRLNDIYVKPTNQTIDIIEKSVERDKFMTPEEAKEFGIVDDVVVHRIVSDDTDESTPKS